VEQEIANQGLKLSRPDVHSYAFPLPGGLSIYMFIRNKAVADGAVSYYLDHFVVGRIARHTYGIPISVLYDPADPDHRKRKHMMFEGIAGEDRLRAFHPTIVKVTTRFLSIDRVPWV
jgi:hypothetical protein